MTSEAGPEPTATELTVGSAATEATVGSSTKVLLDNRRTPCAVGLIRAAERMHELSAGTVLEIWSRDHFAPMEIPIWAERDGHRAVSRGRTGSWPFRYFVFEVTKDGLREVSGASSPTT